jgi:hypothetical protein
LTSSAKAPPAPALRENRAAQDRLDGLIAGCFVIQKLYGRQPENIEVINQTFHSVLGKYPSDAVMRSFELWLERSQEFPTPADIVGLIKRNGKPPLSQAMYVAIQKKSGEDRTPADWQYLREYESQQREEFDGPRDARYADEVNQENQRLRVELKELRAEYDRLARLLREAQPVKGLEPRVPTAEEKVRATIAAMRAAGASEDDVEQFAREHGASSGVAV